MAELAVPLMAVGTLVSAGGTLMAGASANRAAKFEAAQLEARGKAEQAAESRNAAETARLSRIKASRAQAVGAASGGGVDENLLGEIAEEGEYGVLSALYRGEEARKGRVVQAAARRAEGKAAMQNATFKAAGTLIGGGGNIAAKYG